MKNRLLLDLIHIFKNIPYRLNKFSITKRIALSALISISIIILSLNYYSSKILQPSILANEKQKIAIIANYIVNDIEAALDFGSQASVEHIISNANKSSDIKVVYFENKDSSLNVKKKFKENSIELFTKNTENPYFAIHKFINDTHFVLYYDASNYLKNKEDYRKFISLLTFILIFIAFIALVYFKLLLLPFTKTAHAMLNIDLNNPTPDESLLDINTKDERQDIVSAFFILSKKILDRTVELDELNATLEEKVQSRTQKLQDAMQALGKQKRDVLKTLTELRHAQNQLIEVEKMASLGALVAGVAHEINTPVGISYTGITHVIRSSKKLLTSYKNSTMTEDDFNEYFEDTKEFHTIIEANLIRAANLIKSFKQVAVDQLSEKMREFNVSEYIDETLLSLKNRFKNRSISLNINCDEHLIIKSYPGIWSQIFTNLILNSLLHGFDKDDVGFIDISITTENKMIIVDYKDSGKGIKQENLQQIFDPFFTTARAKGGSGLGLHIVYNLITSTLQGAIKCQSNVNEGVHFTIEIPLNIKEK